MAERQVERIQYAQRPGSLNDTLTTGLNGESLSHQGQPATVLYAPILMRLKVLRTLATHTLEQLTDDHTL